MTPVSRTHPVNDGFAVRAAAYYAALCVAIGIQMPFFPVWLHAQGIGVSVGARGNDILLQFLIESLVLSLIGGTLGIGIGIAGTVVLSAFTQWPTLFSVNAILLAFLFSGSVGVFFGFYPARKASLLSPIEALRYE